jgi:hypothetical protein
MAPMKTNIRDSLAGFFFRRAEKKPGSAPCPAWGETSGPQEALVFDTITLESIVSLRGQNPFPEEEGEMGSMSITLRERSLHSL